VYAMQNVNHAQQVERERETQGAWKTWLQSTTVVRVENSRLS